MAKIILYWTKNKNSRSAQIGFLTWNKSLPNHLLQCPSGFCLKRTCSSRTKISNSNQRIKSMNRWCVTQEERSSLSCVLTSAGRPESLDFEHHHLYRWAWGDGQMGQAGDLIHGPRSLWEEGEVRGGCRRSLREVWGGGDGGEVRQRWRLREVRHFRNRRQVGGWGRGLQHVWKKQMRSLFAFWCSS